MAEFPATKARAIKADIVAGTGVVAFEDALNAWFAAAEEIVVIDVQVHFIELATTDLAYRAFIFYTEG